MWEKHKNRARGTLPGEKCSSGQPAQPLPLPLPENKAAPSPQGQSGQSRGIPSLEYGGWSQAVGRPGGGSGGRPVRGGRRERPVGSREGDRSVPSGWEGLEGWEEAEQGRAWGGQGQRLAPGGKDAPLGSPGQGLTTLPNYRLPRIFWCRLQPGLK